MAETHSPLTVMLIDSSSFQAICQCAENTVQVLLESLAHRRSAQGTAILVAEQNYALITLGLMLHTREFREQSRVTFAKNKTKKTLSGLSSHS